LDFELDFMNLYRRKGVRVGSTTEEFDRRVYMFKCRYTSTLDYINRALQKYTNSFLFATGTKFTTHLYVFAKKPGESK